MKRHAFFILFVSLFIVDVRADEPTGIRFFSGSWQEVLNEAKRQNKPLFVDFYTTWCPPCQRMAREAFPNPSVGAKFNEQFINYQVNAEVGEGFPLAKRYAVQSYPTALFIIPTGELVHRAVGYGGVSAMLKQADIVLSMPKVRRSVAKRKRTNRNNLLIPTVPNQPDSAKI